MNALVSLKFPLPAAKAGIAHPRQPRPLPSWAPTGHARSRVHALASLRPGETPEQALERRMRESERVEERVSYICSIEEWEDEVAKAGDRLVVIEVHSDEVCQTGFEEEAELHWKADKLAALEPCRNMKHTFQRTARDCPDVVFLAAEADSEEGHELCDHLGIEVLPTLQFWRHGKLLWEHRGIVQLEQDLGEGVLYFGDVAANNEKASSYIEYLHSREDLEKFLAGAGPKELAIVDVSVSDAAPCVHVFPAVLALARSFKGFARFARLMGDENEELKALMAELNVTQVPSFVFYRGGEMVGRHVGSSRGDLIGQILAQQAAAGIQPPESAAGARRKASAKARRN